MDILKAKTSTAQLAEIRQQIADAAGELRRFDDEIARRIMPVMKGDTAAIAATAELKSQKRDVEERLETLRLAESDRARAVAREAEERRQAEAVALLAKLAGLVERSLALDDRIMDLGREQAATMREKLAIDEEISRLTGNETFDRARTRTPALIRDALAPLYRLNAALPDQPGVGGNNMLGLQSGLLGPQRGMTLRQLDEPRFDDLVPYYTSEAAARAAAGRLKGRNSPVTVSRVGDVWLLLRHDEMFATEAEARRAADAAARRGIALVVVAHGPGFRVCPARFADSEIMITDAARPAA